MALSTFSGLVDSLSAWLDGSDLGGREADMIALCEDEINARLAGGLNAGSVVRPMMQIDPIMIDAEYVDMPDGNTVLPISIELSGLSRPWQVKYVSPDSLIRMKFGQDGEGQAIAMAAGANRPRYFSVIGDQLRFFPAPETGFDAALTRFVKIPALSNDVASNWVLASHRNAYLYGALAQAEMFGWNSDGMANWATLFANAVDGIIARYPVQPSNAPLTSELGGFGATCPSSYWAGDL